MPTQLHHRLLVAVKALLEANAAKPLRPYPPAISFSDDPDPTVSLFAELDASCRALTDAPCVTCGEERPWHSFCPDCSEPICAVCDGTREHEEHCGRGP